MIILSVLSHTYRNFALLVVDEGKVKIDQLYVTLVPCCATNHKFL
jgi:hypothetical protein